MPRLRSRTGSHSPRERRQTPEEYAPLRTPGRSKWISCGCCIAARKVREQGQRQEAAEKESRWTSAENTPAWRVSHRADSRLRSNVSAATKAARTGVPDFGDSSL